METSNKDMLSRDDSGSRKNEVDLNAEVHKEDTKFESEEIEVNREMKHSCQEHGNKRYKMFRNHSSANDQPFTRTDTTP